VFCRDGNYATPTEHAAPLVIHVRVNNLNELTPDRARRLGEWLRTLQQEQKVSEVHLEWNE
jgi:hypothetical protein